MAALFLFLAAFVVALVFGLFRAKKGGFGDAGVDALLFDVGVVGGAFGDGELEKVKGALGLAQAAGLASGCDRAGLQEYSKS